ncbi:MAG: alpha/beta hydrolase [Acidimicrobiales bacterium]
MNRRIVVLAVLLLVAIGVWWSLQEPERVERTPAEVGASVQRDIAYGPHERNRLDVYTPDLPGPFPTIIWLHPGGWTSGDKARSMPVWDWTERGYAVVAVDYRYAIAPDTVADSVDDALAAVGFVIDHHADWNLDSDRIGVYGFSAGGHLAAMVGHADLAVAAIAIAGAPTDFDPLLDPGVTFFDGKRGPAVVDAARALLGCTASPGTCDRLATESSPAQLSPGSADLLIVHGDRDPIVDIDQAYRLHDHLVAEGAAPLLVIVEGGSHEPHVTEGGIDVFFDERLLS